MTTNNYQIWKNGAAWSTVRPCELSAEVERVESILADERARVSGPNDRDGWIENRVEFGVSPVTIEVRRWDYETRTSTVVVRWVRGSRTALSSREWSALSKSEKDA